MNPPLLRHEQQAYIHYLFLQILQVRKENESTPAHKKPVPLYLSTHYKESPKSCIPIPHKVVFSSPDSSLFISCSISHLPFPQDLNSAPILNGTNSSPRTAPVPHHQW